MNVSSRFGAVIVMRLHPTSPSLSCGAILGWTTFLAVQISSDINIGKTGAYGPLYMAGYGGYGKRIQPLTDFSYHAVTKKDSRCSVTMLL